MQGNERNSSVYKGLDKVLEVQRNFLCLIIHANFLNQFWPYQKGVFQDFRVPNTRSREFLL